MPASDAAILRLIFDDAPISEDWITPAAREQLTPELLATIAGQVRALGGDLESVVQTGDEWRLDFERVRVSARLWRDSGGLIHGFLIQQPVPRADSVDAAVAAIAALSGETAVLVTRGETDLAAHSPDAPLLVGSAFKLAVLGTVAVAVEAGDLAWTDVVPLTSVSRSLPTGSLQDFPVGHPTTVATLAALMISNSDNTATDHLMRLVSGESLEQASGSAPLLTTGQYFRLKANAALFERYIVADTEQRRVIQRELDALPLPNISAVAVDRTDHGWRMSTRSLCALIGAVSHLDLMTISPGVAQRSDWERIGFKGGSDLGLVNLTFSLQAMDGQSYCVSATWNTDMALDDVKFAGLTASLIDAVRGLGNE